MKKPSKFIHSSLIYLSFILGAPHWNVNGQEPFYTPDGYTIETLATPKNMPFGITGLDISQQNDIYVATRLGEVWILENRFAEPGKEQWRRFAEGLTEPTGLLLDDNGSILVAHKPELTRLVDTNKDGVADEFSNLANQWEFHDNYHEYNYGPVKDKDGSYYGVLNLGHGNPKAFSLGAMNSEGGYRGWAYKVSASGEFTPFASGFRSPAGIGMSPQNELFITDNQGDWVPTSKLHLVEQNKFYGHPVSLRDDPRYDITSLRKMTPDDFAEFMQPPVLWIPHIEVANSPGNPEWDISQGKFGPFAGQMFIGDYTQSSLFRAIIEKVNGQYQGAVINFMNGFQSGNIRIKFDHKGQLWVGQTSRGWGTKGEKPHGLQRVVWDGETLPFELHDIKITKHGFDLRFTEPLKSGSVQNDSLSAEQWHYLYSSNYGSDKMDLITVKIKALQLSEDNKTLKLTMPLSAGQVVAIDFSGIESVSGRKPSVSKVYYTVNQVK